MARTVDEVATYLAAQSVGTVGTDLFKESLPATPDACVMVRETGGASPDPGFGSTAARFERPALQIIARGAADDVTGPYDKAWLAWVALMAVNPTTSMSGTIYHQINPLQNPSLLEVDDNDRSLYAVNFLAEKELS